MSTTQLLEIKAIIQSQKSTQKIPDRHTKKMLVYLFTSTRGGFTRLKIITLLLQQPCNMHQLTKVMAIDYKAVQHHMQVLEKNNLVSKIGGKYGAVYHLSNFLEINIRALDEAIDLLERKMNFKKVYH